MSSFNKVVLVGNLTRDPELKYTQGGAAVCEFGMAVNRKWKTQAGEQQEEVFFGDITAWGKLGETADQYLSKGRAVLVEGYLKLDQWEGKCKSCEGAQKMSKVKIVAQNIQFLGGGQGGGQQGGGGGSTSRGGQQNPDGTVGRGGQNTVNRGGDGGPSLDDQDIPF